MSAPKRIQRRRVKGWRLPPGAKIVDRSSRWGNPFAVRRRNMCDVTTARTVTKDSATALMPVEWVVVPIRDLPCIISGVEAGTVETGTVLARFSTREEAHVDAVARYRMWIPTSGLDVGLLTGFDLACPCGPEFSCHVDVLLELANPTEAFDAR